MFVALTMPGWVGVNLFFVLSGFLIAGILLDTKSRADYYGRSYKRKALRILPLYYAVLVLLLVLARTGLVQRANAAIRPRDVELSLSAGRRSDLEVASKNARALAGRDRNVSPVEREAFAKVTDG
jgi:peptidoglycan/LPS O-acetylase OafA/YrhL